MEIIKGKQYRCIKTLKTNDGSEAFIKGKIYASTINGCLTNELGNSAHSINSTLVDEYFLEFKENSLEVLHKSGIDVFPIIKHHNYLIGNAILHLLKTGYINSSNSDISSEINELNLVKFYIDEQINMLLSDNIKEN